MMNKTGIEYLDYSWNPMHGCTPVSTGCKNCWAKTMSKRLAGMGVNGYSKNDPFKVMCSPDRLDEPFKTKKPSHIGVSFMGDLFHDDVPLHYINSVFLTMIKADWHKYIILTKRSQKMLEFVSTGYGWRASIPNILFGVSIENQETADWRIPYLLSIPTKVRFLSLEPLLEEIDLRWYFWKTGRSTSNKISWVIVGSESGPKARPTETEWVRSIRDQCIEAGVPFFLKQLHINGKKVSMPELDGKVWSEMP